MPLLSAPEVPLPLPQPLLLSVPEVPLLLSAPEVPLPLPQPRRAAVLKLRAPPPPVMWG